MKNNRNKCPTRPEKMSDLCEFAERMIPGATPGITWSVTGDTAWCFTGSAKY